MIVALRKKNTRDDIVLRNMNSAQIFEAIRNGYIVAEPDYPIAYRNFEVTRQGSMYRVFDFVYDIKGNLIDAYTEDFIELIDEHYEVMESAMETERELNNWLLTY